MLLSVWKVKFKEDELKWTSNDQLQSCCQVWKTCVSVAPCHFILTALTKETSNIKKERGQANIN